MYVTLQGLGLYLRIIRKESSSSLSLQGYLILIKSDNIVIIWNLLDYRSQRVASFLLRVTA